MEPEGRLNNTETEPGDKSSFTDSEGTVLATRTEIAPDVMQVLESSIRGHFSDNVQIIPNGIYECTSPEAAKKIRGAWDSVRMEQDWNISSITPLSPKEANYRNYTYFTFVSPPDGSEDGSPTYVIALIEDEAPYSKNDIGKQRALELIHGDTQTALNKPSMLEEREVPTSNNFDRLLEELRLRSSEEPEYHGLVSAMERIKLRDKANASWVAVNTGLYTLDVAVIVTLISTILNERYITPPLPTIKPLIGISLGLALSASSFRYSLQKILDKRSRDKYEAPVYRALESSIKKD